MRIAQKSNIMERNFYFSNDVFITPTMLLDSISHCYNTLDMIDSNLIANGSPKVSQLIELANLSSIVGNLLGAGFAQYSNGLYERNKPHTYPDIIPIEPNLAGIEIKTALETNSPKGHQPKEGYYITYRYVLTNENGEFLKGTKNRGDTVTIWEVKFGYLYSHDFSCSNTEGDSGKTAVIKTDSFNKMQLLYFDESCIPYKHTNNTPYKGYN
ncbi:Transcriptional regulator, XRE family (fragment) [uncultured Eubacteriales bacterium]|uniref:Transcriptional regulator, XRE family n=1 Tax=uncultured Eubacteriales bacterium TaxID=172733 RepID=A0A212JGM1_9FIRM